MLDFINNIGAMVSAFFKTRLTLQVENADLRHQLIILRRSAPRRLSALISEMSLAHPLWVRRGSMVSYSSLGFKYLNRPWRLTWTHPIVGPVRPGPRSFIITEIKQLQQNFFVVRTLTFHMLYVMVVPDHARRRILHIVLFIAAAEVSKANAPSGPRP